MPKSVDNVNTLCNVFDDDKEFNDESKKIHKSNSFLWDLCEYPCVWDKYVSTTTSDDIILEISASHGDEKSITKCLLEGNITKRGYHRALVVLSGQGSFREIYAKVLERCDLENINTKDLLLAIARGGNTDMWNFMLPFIILKHTDIENIDEEVLLKNVSRDKNRLLWVKIASYLISKYNPQWKSTIIQHCRNEIFNNPDLAEKMEQIVNVCLHMQQESFSHLFKSNKLNFVEYDIGLMKNAVFSHSEQMIQTVWNSLPEDKQKDCDVRCWMASRGQLEALIYMDNNFDNFHPRVAPIAYQYKCGHILEYCLVSKKYDPEMLQKVMKSDNRLNDMIVSIMYRHEDREMLEFCIKNNFFNIIKLGQIMEPNHPLNDLLLCSKHNSKCAIV